MTRPTALKRKSRLTRAQKSEMTRQSLLGAAAKVVGAAGYAAASIADITARAGVAQGTFYNYFSSREELFDQLLPHLGEQMLDFIGECTRNIEDPADREEAGLRAFFDFMKVRPEFYRVLYEAETFAPAAFRDHTDNVARGFMRVLGRGVANNDLAPQHLEALSFMLMGVRHYLAMRYARDGAAAADVPDWVVDTYMNMLRGGIGFRREFAPKERK